MEGSAHLQNHHHARLIPPCTQPGYDPEGTQVVRRGGRAHQRALPRATCVDLRHSEEQVWSKLSPAPLREPFSESGVSDPQRIRLEWIPVMERSAAAQFQVLAEGGQRVTLTPAQTKPGQQRRTCEESALGTVRIRSAILQMVYDHLRYAGRCSPSAEHCACLVAHCCEKRQKP